jgi:predicted nucleic acid-binding protein
MGGYWRNRSARSEPLSKSGLRALKGHNHSAGRVLSFDEKAALIWGELMAQGKAAGRPRSALDTIVAAVAQSNGCIVVTDNERDFHGIEIINPIRANAM